MFNKMLQYIGDYVKVILIKGSSVSTTVVNRQRNSDSVINLINYLGLNKKQTLGQLNKCSTRSVLKKTRNLQASFYIQLAR